jgi:hypothetical protein
MAGNLCQGASIAAPAAWLPAIEADKKRLFEGYGYALILSPEDITQKNIQCSFVIF